MTERVVDVFIGFFCGRSTVDLIDSQWWQWNTHCVTESYVVVLQTTAACQMFSLYDETQQMSTDNEQIFGRSIWKIPRSCKHDIEINRQFPCYISISSLANFTFHCCVIYTPVEVSGEWVSSFLTAHQHKKAVQCHSRFQIQIITKLTCILDYNWICHLLSDYHHLQSLYASSWQYNLYKSYNDDLRECWWVHCFQGQKQDHRIDRKQ